MIELDGAYTLRLRPLEQSLHGSAFFLRSFEAVAEHEEHGSTLHARFSDWSAFASQLARLRPAPPERSLDKLHLLLAHGHSIVLSPQLGFASAFCMRDLEKIGFSFALSQAS